MTEQQDAALAIEQVLVGGDLAKLTPTQRLKYYKLLCEALSLNYLTRPFEYVTINGKMTLYARRDATDQLRKIHGVAITIVSRERYDDAYVVTARASMPNGRTDESVGAVSLKGLQGVEFANALMKAETKAKRRVTLSIVGLGWSDETEVEDIAGALIQAAKPMKAIASARKFQDLNEEEKRDFLDRGWLRITENLGKRGITIELIPAPDFKTEGLSKLIQAASLLQEAEKEEDLDEALKVLDRLHTFLTTQPDELPNLNGKESTNDNN